MNYKILNFPQQQKYLHKPNGSVCSKSDDWFQMEYLSSWESSKYMGSRNDIYFE